MFFAYGEISLHPAFFLISQLFHACTPVSYFYLLSCLLRPAVFFLNCWLEVRRVAIHRIADMKSWLLPSPTRSRAKAWFAKRWGRIKILNRCWKVAGVRYIKILQNQHLISYVNTLPTCCLLNILPRLIWIIRWKGRERIQFAVPTPYS